MIEEPLQIFWMALKVAYVVAFGLYVSFSVVIVSQVRQMTKTLSGGVEKQAVVVAWLHFLLALLALIWAIVVI